jgi:hypothetical protein
VRDNRRTLRVDCAKCGAALSAKYERNHKSYSSALASMRAAARNHVVNHECDGKPIFSVEVYP